jgi:hypothetical protein
MKGTQLTLSASLSKGGQGKPPAGPSAVVQQSPSKKSKEGGGKYDFVNSKDVSAPHLFEYHMKL